MEGEGSTPGGAMPGGAAPHATDAQPAPQAPVSLPGASAGEGGAAAQTTPAAGAPTPPPPHAEAEAHAPPPSAMAGSYPTAEPTPPASAGAAGATSAAGAPLGGCAPCAYGGGASPLTARHDVPGAASPVAQRVLVGAAGAPHVPAPAAPHAAAAGNPPAPSPLQPQQPPEAAVAYAGGAGAAAAQPQPGGGCGGGAAAMAAPPPAGYAPHAAYAQPAPGGATEGPAEAAAQHAPPQPPQPPQPQQQQPPPQQAALRAPPGATHLGVPGGLPPVGCAAAHLPVGGAMHPLSSPVTPTVGGFRPYGAQLAACVGGAAAGTAAAAELAGTAASPAAAALGSAGAAAEGAAAHDACAAPPPYAVAVADSSAAAAAGCCADAAAAAAGHVPPAEGAGVAYHTAAGHPAVGAEPPRPPPPGAQLPPAERAAAAVKQEEGAAVGVGGAAMEAGGGGGAPQPSPPPAGYAHAGVPTPMAPPPAQQPQPAAAAAEDGALAPPPPAAGGCAHPSAPLAAAAPPAAPPAGVAAAAQPPAPLGAAGAAAPPPPPAVVPPPEPAPKQLKVEDALAYLDQVKIRFEKQPSIYNQFLDIMKEFKAQTIDTPGVIRRVLQLFGGNNGLILGFNTFLPPGYRIEILHDATAPDGTGQRVHVTYPPTSPTTPGGGCGVSLGAGCAPGGGGAMCPPGGALGARPAPGCVGAADPAGALGGGGGGAPGAMHPPPPGAAAGAAAAGGGGGAHPGVPTNLPKRQQVEFDQAISYVTKIKQRFQRQPETYKKFLAILHTYQQEQKSIKEVYERVRLLFEDHPDLLDEFRQFLPGPEARADGGDGPLDERGRPLPYGAAGAAPGMWGAGLGGRVGLDGGRGRGRGGRAADRGGRANGGGAAYGGAGALAPLSEEAVAAFFFRCRRSLPKHAFFELLKCTDMYSRRIVDGWRLMALVRPLFVPGHEALFSLYAQLIRPEHCAAFDEVGPEDEDDGDDAYGADAVAGSAAPGPGSVVDGDLDQLAADPATAQRRLTEALARCEEQSAALASALDMRAKSEDHLTRLRSLVARAPEGHKLHFATPPLPPALTKMLHQLYGAAHAPSVAEALETAPEAAAAVVLGRLSQKRDEWSAAAAEVDTRLAGGTGALARPGSTADGLGGGALGALLDSQLSDERALSTAALVADMHARAAPPPAHAPPGAPPGGDGGGGGGGSSAGGDEPAAAPAAPSEPVPLTGAPRLTLELECAPEAASVHRDLLRLMSAAAEARARPAGGGAALGVTPPARSRSLGSDVAAGAAGSPGALRRAGSPAHGCAAAPPTPPQPAATSALAVHALWAELILPLFGLGLGGGGGGGGAAKSDGGGGGAPGASAGAEPAGARPMEVDPASPAPGGGGGPPPPPAAMPATKPLCTWAPTDGAVTLGEPPAPGVPRTAITLAGGLRSLPMRHAKALEAHLFADRLLHAFVRLYAVAFERLCRARRILAAPPAAKLGSAAGAGAAGGGAAAPAAAAGAGAAAPAAADAAPASAAPAADADAPAAAAADAAGAPAPAAAPMAVDGEAEASGAPPAADADADADAARRAGGDGAGAPAAGAAASGDGGADGAPAADADADAPAAAGAPASTPGAPASAAPADADGAPAPAAPTARAASPEPAEPEIDLSTPAVDSPGYERALALLQTAVTGAVAAASTPAAGVAGAAGGGVAAAHLAVVERATAELGSLQPALAALHRLIARLPRLAEAVHARPLPKALRGLFTYERARVAAHAYSGHTYRANALGLVRSANRREYFSVCTQRVGARISRLEIAVHTLPAAHAALPVPAEPHPAAEPGLGADGADGAGANGGAPPAPLGARAAADAAGAKGAAPRARARARRPLHPCAPRAAAPAAPAVCVANRLELLPAVLGAGPPPDAAARAPDARAPLFVAGTTDVLEHRRTGAPKRKRASLAEANGEVRARRCARLEQIASALVSRG